MRNGQPRFPISLRTGWIDYSPALREHATGRIRSRLAEFAPQIRSIAVRIADDEPQQIAQRRCEIEVVTAHAAPIIASSVGVDLFTLIDHAVDTVNGMLRQRSSGGAASELRQRIA